MPSAPCATRFENAFLERQAFEERFQVDVLLGDLTWETSYGLPGEGLPPRVQADITLDWPTWAQTAYRSWYIGEPFDERPRIEIEIVMRVQRLAEAPDPRWCWRYCPSRARRSAPSPWSGRGPTIETVYSADLDEREYAIEVSYEGSYELDEETLEDGTILDDHLARHGRLDRVDAGEAGRPDSPLPAARRRRPLTATQAVAVVEIRVAERCDGAQAGRRFSAISASCRPRERPTCR